MKKNKLKKQQKFAFGKKIVLLGISPKGEKFWLEAPSWDCDWYWGFGFVETYSNFKNPETAKDITSHQHIKNGFIGYDEEWNSEHQVYIKRDYVANIYRSPKLEKTTFSEDEGWILSELFKQYYLLRDIADFCHLKPAGAGVMPSPVDHGDMTKLYLKINNEMIPRVTTKIMEILTK